MGALSQESPPVLRLTGRRPDGARALPFSFCSLLKRKIPGGWDREQSDKASCVWCVGTCWADSYCGTLESTRSCPEKFTVFTEQAFGCGFFKNPEFQASVYQIAYTSKFIELLKTEIHRAVQMPKSADCLRHEQTLETEYN